MGWGIMGGSAVDAYQKANKIARDQAWEDTQHAEITRQQAQDVGIDNATKDASTKLDTDRSSAQAGTGIDSSFVKKNLPGLDDDAAGQLAISLQGMNPDQVTAAFKQYQPQYGMKANPVQPAAGLSMGTTPQPTAKYAPTDSAAPGGISLPSMDYDPSKGLAPQLGMTSAPSGPSDPSTMTPSWAKPAPTPARNQPATQAQLDDQPFRAFRGRDGSMYMTAADEHKAKPSEHILAQAAAIRSGGYGMKGINAANALQTHGLEMMKSEQIADRNAIMNDRSKSDAEKADALAGLIGASPGVPGTAKIVTNADGTFLTHEVPGSGDPFMLKLSGATSAERLSHLGASIAAMTDPELQAKHATEQINRDKVAMENQHYIRSDDNRLEIAANKREVDFAKLAAQGVVNNALAGQSSSALEVKRMQNAAENAQAEARIAQQRQEQERKNGVVTANQDGTYTKNGVLYAAPKSDGSPAMPIQFFQPPVLPKENLFAPKAIPVAKPVAPAPAPVAAPAAQGLPQAGVVPVKYSNRAGSYIKYRTPDGNEFDSPADANASIARTQGISAVWNSK